MIFKYMELNEKGSTMARELASGMRLTELW